MYDNLICKHPLPDGSNPEGRGFQTKDTDAQRLDTYTITAEGRLVHTERDWEVVPKEQRPYPNATGWRAARGCMRAVNHRDVDTNFSGQISFYDGSIDYTARFGNGQLVGIVVGQEWHT
ncbi:MAG TPA: hypothetical protein VEB22_11510 [Phycisphaerales bacterium]|nr:hypothetical protein [Phycisphaerales bacterium]